MLLTLEQLTHENFSDALCIDLDGIPEAWVDSAATLMETTDYGAEHHFLGHTYLARRDGKPVGLIMIGEALTWDTDPGEMRGRPFYRAMGFKNTGIGASAAKSWKAPSVGCTMNLGNAPWRWGFTRTIPGPAPFKNGTAFIPRACKGIRENH